MLRYLQYVQEGNADAALRFLAAHSPSAGARLVDLMLTCVNAIVGLGFLIFLLNSLRATAPDMGNLLDGFNYWWKLLVMNFVCGIFIVLWSLLLVVPGIIAAYRYSMANYILINRPELGIMECIRESKRLTIGCCACCSIMSSTAASPPPRRRPGASGKPRALQTEKLRRGLLRSFTEGDTP